MRSGLDAEALALLRDFLATWPGSADYDPALAKRFLEQLLAELMDVPEMPDELALNCEASCWVAGELLALGVEPVMERWLYWFVTCIPMTLVPADSLRWAFQYASDNDLSPPWLDGDHAPQ
ncbi:MAG: hypothetical protein QOJ63_2825 [Solirubrobacteraceae bacterium]|nr:hypothetical protein [Solirubrobacteraceae bacterium]